MWSSRNSLISRLITKCFFVVSASTLLAGIAVAQVISVDDPRPVGELAWQLEEKYGIAISYEDPPYLNAEDVVDVSAEVNRTTSKPDLPVLVPREGAIDFIPVEMNANLVESVQRSFNTSLQKYAAVSGKRFKIERVGEMLIISPLNYRTEQGRFQSLRPVFDTKLKIAGKSRTGTEFLQEFCRALTHASGSKVGVGTIPFNLFSGMKTSMKVEGTSARNALLALFAETHQQLSWQLLYGPGEKDYALNIRVLPKHESKSEAMQ